ncbi:hypothetical protein PR202_gb16501 [Eleusine coracana subsp. coracana]|uniref:Major facilitator superfamily (MFS) profile domain-containing protein n=1 Tax=Eleusine coracana subsp. coracana TaxID=191504 RepID=A0AAV5F105_ELECO|nr:hypothetical protein PR202_gb16501 [Eleusine coracana subsp. coracana]
MLDTLNRSRQNAAPTTAGGERRHGEGRVRISTIWSSPTTILSLDLLRGRGPSLTSEAEKRREDVVPTRLRQGQKSTGPRPLRFRLPAAAATADLPEPRRSWHPSPRVNPWRRDYVLQPSLSLADEVAVWLPARGAGHRREGCSYSAARCGHLAPELGMELCTANQPEVLVIHSALIAADGLARSMAVPCLEAPLLQLAPAPAIEGCPWCAMEWRKANSNGRIPYKELFFVGVTTLASAASYMVGRACGAIFWGIVADYIGQKPVIVFSIFSVVILNTLFGLSTTYHMAIATRLVLGALNGLLAPIKVNTAWGFGLIVGPALGGYLAQPAEKYPRIFSESSVFGRFPYLLPCLNVSSLSAVVLISCTWLPVLSLWAVSNRKYGGLSFSTEDIGEVSSLACPNLLGIKGLVVVVVEDDGISLVLFGLGLCLTAGPVQDSILVLV